MTKKVNLEFIMSHPEMFSICKNCACLFVMTEGTNKCPECGAKEFEEITMMSIQGFILRAALDELIPVGEEA